MKITELSGYCGLGGWGVASTHPGSSAVHIPNATKASDCKGTVHFHLVPRLKMCGALIFWHLYVFNARSLDTGAALPFILRWMQKLAPTGRLWTWSIMFLIRSNPGHTDNNDWEYVSIVVFWVVTPCSFVCGYQCFGRTYRLHLQGEMEEIRSSKTSVTTYKTIRRHNPEKY
jgi:hypothetical protein